jgi:hypothetical protein
MAVQPMRVRGCLQVAYIIAESEASGTTRKYPLRLNGSLAKGNTKALKAEKLKAARGLMELWFGQKKEKGKRTNGSGRGAKVVIQEKSDRSAH